MGYGPLVRATVGVTSLWTSDDAADPTRPHAFYDATTIFPDHVVGRITAIGEVWTSAIDPDTQLPVFGPYMVHRAELDPVTDEPPSVLRGPLITRVPIPAAEDPS